MPLWPWFRKSSSLSERDDPPPPTAEEIVFAYHRRTKHHFLQYARSLGYLDWDTQPDPWRRYEGAPRTNLLLSKPVEVVPYEALFFPGVIAPVPLNLEALAAFFRCGLGLSAWKEIQTARWALRANPSSGNLHPTEAYAVLGPLTGLSETPGLFHYLSENHSLEQRCRLTQPAWEGLSGELPPGAFLVGITSILWREAWKYGERAFRYCLHDTGHAVAALRFSAALLGWEFRLLAGWPQEAVERLLGLDRLGESYEGEREEAELLAVVGPPRVPHPTLLPPTPETLDLIAASEWLGKPNQLSPEHVAWEVVDLAAEATRFPGWEGPVNRVLPLPPAREKILNEAHRIILQRRSAVDFDGKSSLPSEKFYQIISRLRPSACAPWDVLWWSPQVHLALFVHRVTGLESGLYFLVRNPAHEDALKKAMRKEFGWEKPPDAPEGFYRLQSGDFRGTAGRLSCDQAIASDSFFSLGMIAAFKAPIGTYGTWFYRNLFWEAGAIGQVLYLEAEAAGARGTGIGCYYDDPVHDLLGLQGMDFQSLYHFTLGIPVEDTRLTTLPGYEGEEPWYLGTR